MDQSALTTTGETPAKLTYMLEETNECCYRDVSAALMARGYSSVPFQRKMKQKKKKAQLKHGVLPSFIWAINERDIDYTELFPFQVVNHFEGISKLTTKQGLCEILRGMAWVDENDHNVCPRSYDLSQPSQRAEFSDDFRLSAASNILKHCSMKKTLRSVTVFSERVIKLSMTAITVYLAMALHGDWSGMLPFGELGALDRGDFGLLDTEWAEILRASYDLAALEPLPEWCLGEIHQRDDILLPSVTQLKIRLLLRGLQKVWPQLYINGMRNIWIVKAPVVSRGTGIRICSKLEEIFDLEKRIAGRIVQKYVETPLLVPRLSTYLNMNSNLSTQVKFDTRIWVAITCFQPLKAFIYSTIYGRKCSKAYSNGTKQLNDDLIHLTNYSVQKHSNGSASSSTHAPGSNYQNVGKDDATLPVSLVEKLRGTIATSTAAKRPSSARLDGRRSSRATDSTNGSDSAANLMLTHDELLSFLDFKCNGQGREVWEQNVWPEIRLRIASLLKASREYVKPRDKTFELLGVDVILDDRLVPWILEANMSPGLSHRNEKHNALIRDMIENLMQKVLNCQVPAGGGSPHSNVGTKLGAWEELDTTSCSNTDIERWTGIPVNIPNSKYHLISGEGKINKTWLSVLKSGSLSAFDGSSGATNSNFDDLDTYNAKSNVENLESEKTSYLKEKFNELKNSSFMQETAAASDITNKAVSSVNTMVNFKKTTPRTSVMDSRDWSQNLRSSDMDSSTSKKNRFITTSKKDLLNVVNSSSDIHGRKSNHGMTPTEKRLQQYIQNSSNLDPATLIVVGTEVSRQKIHTIDLAIRHSEKLDLLQRWSRRYLIRVRAYHRKRRVAAIFLQCLARQIIARQTVNALVRKKSAVALQSRMRSHLARLEANRRRKEKAGLLLCRKLYHFAIFRRKEKIFRSGRSKTIQRFLRMCMQVFYNKNALVIGRQAKKWVILRWRNRLIVRHMIALYFRHRVTSATVIKRSSIFKQYLNYLRTRRRRRRHLLRVLTTQAKKPSKGLRHVVKISVTYDVVVIDKGQSEDVFSPLFKYNSIQKELRNNNNSEAETFSLRNDERTDEDKNPLPHIPPASKALDLVNAMLNECEKSPHEVNTKDMSSILPNRNCTKFPEHKEDFNIVEYVARHADEPIGCRPHHPVVESVPQKKNRLQFDLSHDMIVEKKGKPEKTNSGIEIAYQEQTDDSTRKLRAEFVATDTRSSDGSGDERSTTDEDEDFLFQRDVVNPRGDMTEVDLREENISTAPSSEVVLNLELEEFCEEHQNQDSNFHNTGGRNSMIEGRLCDISGKKGKIECASNRNKLLDQPNLLQDYDLPPKIRINDSLQTGEQFYRHVSCPKNSLNVECKFVKKKCRSSKSMKKSTRTDYDGAPATSKKRNRTKEVVESQLKLAKSNAVDDPDVIYREQLERQLNLAKEKYAQRQRKRQDEALSRPSNFVREVSAPFDTKLKPSEAAWDIRNTKRGAQTKLIDAEKEEALQLAAEWNSELYELQQEQMRKRAKDYANEQARKASEDARRRNVLSNRCTESTGENGQGFATAPVEVPRRVRPKSAGNSYRDSRSFATNQQSQCHPDSSGGYLLEAYEAPIRCKEDLESGYHPDLIHSRQQAHVMTAQRSHTFQTGASAYATGGTIDSRLSANNRTNTARERKPKPPPRMKRPKSAGTLGASRRRQAARLHNGENLEIFDTVVPDEAILKKSQLSYAAPQSDYNDATSDSLWTSQAARNDMTLDFSQEEVYRIEEELLESELHPDPAIGSTPNKQVNTAIIETDSDDDDVEVALAKWMKKQEEKNKKSDSSNRMRVDSRYKVASFTNTSQLASNSLPWPEDSHQRQEKAIIFAQGTEISSERYEFDSSNAVDWGGMRRGANSTIDMVGTGFSSNIVPGAKVPVSSHLLKQFEPPEDILARRKEIERSKRHGYSNAYKKGQLEAEYRAEWVHNSTVPADVYKTYSFDSEHKVGDSTSTRNSQMAEAHKDLFEEVDSDIFGRKRPPPLHSVSNSRQGNLSNSMNQDEMIDDVSHSLKDPLDESVQKLRSAYSCLSWDF